MPPEYYASIDVTALVAPEMARLEREWERVLAADQQFIDMTWGFVEYTEVELEPLRYVRHSARYEAALIDSISQDTLDILFDYVREGNRQDFNDLATMSGIKKEHLDEVWSGLMVRLGVENAK